MKSLELGAKARNTVMSALAIAACAGVAAIGIGEHSSNQRKQNSKRNAMVATMAVKNAALVEQLAAKEHVTAVDDSNDFEDVTSTLYEFGKDQADRYGEAAYEFNIARDRKTGVVEAVDLAVFKNGRVRGVWLESDKNLTVGGNDPDRSVHLNSWNIRLVGQPLPPHGYDNEKIYAATPDIGYGDYKLTDKAVDNAQELINSILVSAAADAPIADVFALIDRTLPA